MDPPSPLLLAHELLPLIFSPSGVPVPPELLSTATRQAHHFLTSTPDDPLAYWQPITLRREVEEERADYVLCKSRGVVLLRLVVPGPVGSAAGAGSCSNVVAGPRGRS